MPINEIEIQQLPSGQLVTEIELQQGLPGPPNTLAIGTVTPAETGVPAAANITGSSPSQLLHLTLPKGNTGTAATIAVGTTATGAAGSSASVTNGGSSSAAVFNFTIPKGDKGNTGTLSLGTVATGNAGTDVIITNTGTPEAGEFNFTIPRGNTGATGPATELSVVSTSTGEAGSEASVTISGDAPVQSLAFTIPRGDTGQTGPATQLSVASTTTGAAGTNASVTISGTAPNQSLAFTIPQGIQGIQGPTGSSGATAVLTGYVSSPGTVAATDTVIQAVGKLNGNDELKAPIASLYPYIGGKLLTYLDEEAAIADPLISAGDIYRKTTGGVDYVNPDNVPSLDLRFATDKTLTARRGPTPTFTRGSGATYIGSDGLIHGVDTSTTSNTIGTGSRTFTLAATAGQDQFWRAGDAVDASNGLNIMTGTVTSYDAATQSLVCNMTSASGSGTFTSWRIGFRGPRFDHDPVTLACKGLLIEEGRTNICRQSENFGTTWITYFTNLIYLSQVAPNGDPSAYSLVEDTSTTPHAIYQSIAFAGTTNYTFSVFVKAGSRNFASLVEQSSGGAVRRTFFNLSTGEVGTKNASHTASTQQLPNGWWRLIISFTSGAASSNNIAIELASADNVASYLGNGSGNAFIWGAQLEAGSFPTSYIPTTTGTLARSADVCDITGGNFTGMWNQSEGTLLAQTQKTSTNSNAFVISVSDNSFNNETDLRYNSVSQVASLMNVSNVNQLIGFQANITSGAAVKQSIAYKLNDCAYAANGASPISDTSALIPTVNRLTIGNVAVVGQAFYLNGHIASLRYYRKRLPNAKIQALTV
jgi:hypothetical protein